MDQAAQNNKSRSDWSKQIHTIESTASVKDVGLLGNMLQGLQ